MDKISTYRGKPIDEMSREELIDALNFLANDAKREREEHIRQLDVISGVGNAQHSVQRMGLLARIGQWFGAIANR